MERKDEGLMEGERGMKNEVGRKEGGNGRKRIKKVVLKGENGEG